MDFGFWIGKERSRAILNPKSKIQNPKCLTMPQRIAASLALIAFVVCLLIGGLEADNTFATTVGRALVAMAGTFVVGLVLGAMAQKMIDENLKKEEEKLKNSQAEVPPDGR